MGIVGKRRDKDHPKNGPFHIVLGIIISLISTIRDLFKNRKYGFQSCFFSFITFSTQKQIYKKLKNYFFLNETKLLLVKFI